MSGEFDAAGTAIEGALIAAAVEPAGGGPVLDENGESDSICLNCSAALSGAYCASCGQKAHVHRTLSAIGHDLLHSVFHFDGKLWRTLPMLLFKPGELTRRYVHGERAKFVSPMAIFLFSIFLMFAVFSFTGGAAFGEGSSTNFDFKKGMQAEANKLDAGIKATTAKLAEPQLPAAERSALEAKLESLKNDRNGIAFVQEGKPKYPEAGARNKKNGVGISLEEGMETGWPWLDKTLRKGAEKMVSNPSLAFYKLQSNGYKFAWLLIPLSLPFVALVTIGKVRHRFYDHAVFTTYSISFMCLLFLTVAIFARLGVDDSYWGLAFVFLPPLHIYKQLRHAYGFSRRGTIFRMALLMVSIVIILSLFAMTLLFLGLLG
jgi:hypothetical protein